MVTGFLADTPAGPQFQLIEFGGIINSMDIAVEELAPLAGHEMNITVR
jgi:hypothetical protein